MKSQGYDVTGPVRVKEWKSLLLMMTVSLFAGAGLWWKLHTTIAAPSTTLPAAATRQNEPPAVPPRPQRLRDPPKARAPARPPDPSRRPRPGRPPEPAGDFVQWSPDDTQVTAIRSGSTYLNLSIFIQKDGRRML